MSYEPNRYIIGLDLGKKRDYTAMAVLQRDDMLVLNRWESRYDLIRLDRWKDRDYADCIPAIRNVQQALNQLEQQRVTKYIQQEATMWDMPTFRPPHIDVVIDQTGVGEGVVEMLRKSGLRCYGVTIHGGDAVSKMDGGWRVPKRELVATLEVLFQNRRLRFAEGLPAKQILINELQEFRATIKLSGHVSYAASEEWRENPHDDTVLALALAAWIGETYDPHGLDGLHAHLKRFGAKAAR